MYKAKNAIIYVFVYNTHVILHIYKFIFFYNFHNTKLKCFPSPRYCREEYVQLGLVCVHVRKLVGGRTMTTEAASHSMNNVLLMDVATGVAILELNLNLKL